MKVLVDTSVWSLALRHNEQSEITQQLTELILSSLVVMIGPVRQELLSGISNKEIFLKLRAKLGQFDDLTTTTRDFETAADFFNICRKNGVQGSHVDFLICAMAHNYNLLIFTTDRDFENYARYVPVRFLRHTHSKPN